MALQSTQESFSQGRSLPRGAIAPVLDVLDLSGNRTQLLYEGTRQATVLYVFRPECYWCERNSLAVNSLAQQTSRNYRVIGLSLSDEGLADFVESHNITFPVYSDPATAVIEGLQLRATPETIVISPAGRVVASWSGAYMGGAKAELEKFFAIVLPADQTAGN